MGRSIEQQRRIKEAGLVKEARINMKGPLHKVAEEVLPKAKVIIDTFHVITPTGERTKLEG